MSIKVLIADDSAFLRKAISDILIEDKSLIGNADSDGCIRLTSDDIEEIFSIVISRPTSVELVKDFNETTLPGTEKIIK